jgi:predicted transcriptional regulator
MINSYLSYLAYDSTQSLEFYFLKVIYKLEIYLLFMMMEQNVRSLASNGRREKGIKRSKSAIILNILSICTKGASKTKIVYRANLNFKTATPYIELLSQNGLLHERGDSSRLYETTPHGIEVMKTLRQLGDDLL